MKRRYFQGSEEHSSPGSGAAERVPWVMLMILFFILTLDFKGFILNDTALHARSFPGRIKKDLSLMSLMGRKKRQSKL